LEQQSKEEAPSPSLSDNKKGYDEIVREVVSLAETKTNMHVTYVRH